MLSAEVVQRNREAQAAAALATCRRVRKEKAGREKGEP
jgi:hypothetical protein